MKEFPDIPNDTGIKVVTVGDCLVSISYGSPFQLVRLLGIFRGCYEQPSLSWNDVKQMNVSFLLESFVNHCRFENLHYEYSRIAQYIQHKLPREKLPLYIGTIFEPIVADRLSKEEA